MCSASRPDAGQRGVSYAGKTTLRRSFISSNGGRDGMGKILCPSGDPGAADPVAARAFGGVRPCVADAAGGLAGVGIAPAAGDNTALRCGGNGAAIKQGGLWNGLGRMDKGTGRAAA